MISFEKRIFIGKSYAHECWCAIDNDFIINIVHSDCFDHSLIFFSDDWCIYSKYASNYATFLQFKKFQFRIFQAAISERQSESDSQTLHCPYGIGPEYSVFESVPEKVYKHFFEFSQSLYDYWMNDFFKSKNDFKHGS